MLIQTGSSGRQLKVCDLRGIGRNDKYNVLIAFEMLAIGEAPGISYSIPMSLSFRRNQNFTGRKEELVKIHEVLQGTAEDPSHQRTMVLCGLGGIGKSQLAIQYAYTYENTYSSVWWVNASTTASLSQSILGIAQQLVSYHAHLRTSTGKTPDYSGIATMLGLPVDAVDQAGQLGASADTKPIIGAVKFWLTNKNNQEWLIIVDNYDDLETVDIADFLPRSSGHIIITSRSQDSRRLGSSFELDVVSLDDGIEILRKSAGTKSEEFSKGAYTLNVWMIDLVSHYL